MQEKFQMNDLTKNTDLIDTLSIVLQAIGWTFFL